MKKYADRIKEYEREKLKLQLTCKSCEEYEHEIRKLAEKLKI